MNAAPMTLAFGKFTLDESRAELRRGERAVKIEPQAFKLLVYLVHNRDRIVHKTEILDRVWPDAVVGDGSVTYSIGVIREALGDSARKQKILRTYNRKGYRFVARVEVLPDAQQERDEGPPHSPPVSVAVRFCVSRDLDQAVRDEIATRSRSLAGELARRLGGSGEGADVFRFGEMARALTFSEDLRPAIAPRGSLGAEVGIGIHAAVRDDDRRMVAARMAQKAAPGQVLVSREARQLARNRHFAPAGVRRVGERGQRLPLYELVERRPQPGIDEVLRGELPLIGRERDFARARQLLRAAREGRGACLLVAGEPGIGKTRLTGEIVFDAAGLGMTVLQGACFDRGLDLPYAPFARALPVLIDQMSDAELKGLLGDDASWLAGIVPEIASRLPRPARSPSVTPEQERHLVLTAATTLLIRAAERAPLLLVLEDLHWADHSTAHLFAHLARAAGSAPLVVLATYRDAEIGDSHAMAPVLAELQRVAHCETRELSGLEAGAVARLMEAMVGSAPPPALADAVARETEGNPLFVRELLKVLHDEKRLLDARGRWLATTAVAAYDLPHTVQTVIQRRLAQLSAESRNAMRTAAAIGRQWSYDVLRRVAGLERDKLLTAIDEAERARLIEERRESREAVYAFSHELIWRGLYEDSSKARRQELHRAIAAALEEKYGARVESHATDLAHHYRLAGSLVEQTRAARFMALAGDAAMRGSAHDEAARWYGDAAELVEPGSSEQAGLLFKRGDALYRAGCHQEAERHLQRAVELYEALGNRKDLEETYLALMSLHAWQGRFDQMAVALQSGLAVAPASSSRARCLLQSAAGKWLTFQREPVAAAHYMEEALRTANLIGDRLLLANVLATRGGNLWIYTDFAQAAATLEDAARLLEAVGDSTGLLLCEIDHAIALGYLGRLPEMSAALDRVEPLLERFGDPGRIAAFHLGRGILAYVRGDLGQAHRLARGAVARARSGAMIVLPSALILLASIEFALGTWQEVEQHLAEADQANRLTGNPPARYAGRLIPIAMQAFWEDPRAAAELSSLLPAVRVPGTPMACDELDAMMTASEAAVLAGVGELAVPYYQPLRRMAERGVAIGSVFYPLLDRVLGMIAAASGDDAAAGEHFRAALARAERLEMKKEGAQTLFHMAIAARNSGDNTRALSHAAAAADAFEALCMPRHRERAERVTQPRRNFL